MTKLIAAALVLGLCLTGCASNDQLARQFRDGNSKNYIAGDGTVTEFDASKRPSSNPWVGKTESGDLLTNKDLLGQVSVLNFWYAGCAPCRAEAKDLVNLQKEFASKGVQFVGVNVRDTAATALAFDRNFQINYPSVMDNDTGAVVLAFTGVVTPQAVPTTLVIDKHGKVASRILGRIELGTLRTLIQTAVGK